MGLYEKVNGEWVRKQAGNSEDSAAAAHYSMTTIAEGSVTVTSDDEAATDTTLSFDIPNVTLGEIRKYKAVYIQFSAAAEMNSSGNVGVYFVESANRHQIAMFRYKLLNHRAVILFTDAEHYSALVVAASNSSELAGETYATTGGNTNRMGVGIQDYAAMSDDLPMSFICSHAAIGNVITYQVIGLSEEAANFT